MADGCNERMDFGFYLGCFKQYSRARKEKFKSIKDKYPDKTVIFKTENSLMLICQP